MKNKNEKIPTKVLSGFMELLPAEQLAFNTVLNVIQKTYDLFGFISIDTPVLERAEVLLAKAGHETEKQIYQFKKGDVNLAMRFDLTVPLARYVADHYASLTFPFRRAAINKVYRGEKPQAGRFREFYQADIDVIGDSELDIRFDAEIPSIMYMIFKKLGFDNFTIRINNRKILNGLFEYLNLTDKANSIMQIVDKIDKIGGEAVKNELQKLELSSKEIEQVMKFITMQGSSEEIISELKKFGIDNIVFNTGLVELIEVVDLIQKFGVSESNFAVDLKIARGLDYYTGTVYETVFDEYPEIGSVCSGGRYDNLASHYIDRILPGVGISIGLTRLFDQLYKRNLLKIDKITPTQILIFPMTDNLDYCLKIATVLREKNISTEISFGKGKIKKRLSYANKLKIPYVIFIGDDEINKGVYMLKDLATGNQEKLTESELLKKFIC